MTGERNSLLVNRVGGQLYQILADEDTLYVVYLGSMRSGCSLRQGLGDVSEFSAGPGDERIPRDEIKFVHIRRGDDQTEISVNTADGERTWRMNIRIPDAAVRMIFGSLALLCEEMDPEDQKLPESLTEAEGAAFDAMDIPPVPGGELILEVLAGSMAVLLPSLLWVRQSKALFWLNLAYLPLALVLLAGCEGTRFARFGVKRLLMLLPGIALTLINARLNLPNPEQILLPSALIALLLTYGSGAALSVNGLGGKMLRTSRVTPRLVRADWIEAPLDGRQQRFYVHPEVCRRLSVNGPCELQLWRGQLGVEFWTAVPRERPSEV